MVISKTIGYRLNTKQFTVTLAATKNFKQLGLPSPVTFKISGKLVSCAKLEFRTFVWPTYGEEMLVQ